MKLRAIAIRESQLSLYEFHKKTRKFGLTNLRVSYGFRITSSKTFIGGAGGILIELITN